MRYMELVRLSDIGNFLKAIIATMIAFWMTVFITLQFVDANGSVRRYEIKQIGGHEIGLGTVPASPTVGRCLRFTDIATEVPANGKYLWERRRYLRCKSQRSGC